LAVAEALVLFAASLPIAYGLIGLIAMWLVPSLRDRLILKPATWTGLLEHTRANQTLISLWFSCFGAWLVLGTLVWRGASLAALVVFLVMALVISLRPQHAATPHPAHAGPRRTRASHARPRLDHRG